MSEGRRRGVTGVVATPCDVWKEIAEEGFGCKAFYRKDWPSDVELFVKRREVGCEEEIRWWLGNAGAVQHAVTGAIHAADVRVDLTSNYRSERFTVCSYPESRAMYRPCVAVAAAVEAGGRICQWCLRKLAERGESFPMECKWEQDAELLKAAAALGICLSPGALHSSRP